MKDYLSRRGLLRYAGISCISLPLIRVLKETQAYAQAAGNTKAIVIYYPDGSIGDRFFPKETGRSFSLPSITEPLNAVKNRIVLVDGLEFNANGSHEAGAAFCLTGTAQAERRYSLDSILGDKLGGGFPQKIIRLGVGANFQSGSDKYVSFLKSGALASIQDSPKNAFREIFGVPGLNRDDQNSLNIGKRSILDFARSELSSLKQRLGNIEQKKLQDHLDALRELERRVNNGSQTACSPQVNWQGITFPEQETSYPKSYELNERFGQIGAIMIEIMINALACGVAPVAFLQWSHAVSPTQFNFAGGPNVAKGHHDVSHYGGDADGEFGRMFVACQAWYMEQVSKLIRSLEGVKIADRSLLDDTVVFVTTELGDSERHDFKRIACVLAGGGSGRLRTGQSLRFSGRQYIDVLQTVLVAAGVSGEKIGDPSANSNPISEILA